MTDVEEGFADGAYGEGGFDSDGVVADDEFIDDERLIGAGFDDEEDE